MKLNRFFALLLTLCLLAGPAGAALPAAAASASPEASEEAVPAFDEVFVVVHTNDVHGYIDVEPYVKAVADDMKARYGEKNVVTVSAGDVFSGGNAVAHLYNGETIPPIMDAAGYDILVPGNNDFHFDGDQLQVLAGMFAHTRVLSANTFAEVLDENGDRLTDADGNGIHGDPVFDSTATFTTEGGVRVGVFGVSTAGDPPKTIYTGAGSIESAEGAVAALQAEGCGVIVGVGHTGWNDDLETPSANDVTSAALVKAVPGIDAFVDGHSHSVIGGGNGWICPETGTLVNQASCRGAAVGVMKLYLKDGAVVYKTGELLDQEQLEAAYTPDPAVKALVDAAWERLAGDAGEMYIESEFFLNGLRASESPDGRSVRTDETNLGDLIADFLIWYTDADVAMTPGFAIRSSIEQGKIYTLNLYDVFAVGCYIYVYEITGEELLQKMASSLSSLPYESPSFNQIGGASYGYLAPEKASGEAASGEAGSGEAAAEKMFTIIDPTVGGEPLDPAKTYVFASTDGNTAPEGLDPLISTMQEGALAMGEYLKSGEAVIYPDVPTPDGRIVPMEKIPEGAVVYEVSAD